MIIGYNSTRVETLIPCSYKYVTEFHHYHHHRHHFVVEKKLRTDSVHFEYIRYNLEFRTVAMFVVSDL